MEWDDQGTFRPVSQFRNLFLKTHFRHYFVPFRKADMAVIDLSITTSRQEAVDFAMPFMNTGVGILYKKKAPPPPNLFSFLKPLSVDVWIYMITAYLATSILMFLLGR